MDEEQKKSALAAVHGVIEESGVQRSALVQFMLDNHDALLEMLSRKRPNWKRLAEVFAEHGLSEDGKLLSAETVRNYWWRARRIKLGVKPQRRRSAKVSVPAGSVSCCACCGCPACACHFLDGACGV